MSWNDDAFAFACGSNKAWSDYKCKQSDKYFPTLAQGQAPRILWFGCSDSRVPETTILGLQPGDVFTHRNIANILPPTDINSLSVLEYAVGALKVEHIIICGHTSCGGAFGALSAVSDGTRLGGVLDSWLHPLKMLAAENYDELSQLDKAEANTRLVELNVERGVKTLMAQDLVREAVRNGLLQVHGVVFDLACGRVRDLQVGTSKGQKMLTATPAKKVEKPELLKGHHAQLVFGKGGAHMKAV